MRIVFQGVRLVDGVADRARDGVDVVVDGEWIAAIEPTGEPLPPAPPPEGDGDAARGGDGVRIVASRGRTLLPGLIDAHAHYTFDPTEGSLSAIRTRTDATILAAARRHAAMALQAGVTTARGAGSIRDLELTLRDEIAAGTTPGPRLVAAGLAIGSSGGHGHQFGVEADGPTAVAAAVRDRARAGADVVKIVASAAAMLTTTGLEPGRDVFGEMELDEADIRAIVDTAHGLGLRVMSHAQGPDSVSASARAGVDSVEHAWLADPAAIEAIAKSAATLVPTLIVTEVNRTLPGLSQRERDRQDRIEVLHRASCESAIRSGVPIAAGTDTGEVGVTADLVWRELALIRDHGASAMSAIRAGTSTAARLLGIAASVGTVEVGRRADLLLVDGDPLDDLGRMARPVLVVQAGRVVRDDVSGRG
jgi:imidazolonepropionase-like amidohydrolase